jgi:PD-(D/E)XK nuclease superfamily
VACFEEVFTRISKRISKNKEIVMAELLYKHESFEIIGLCVEVHNQLGRGFDENVYKEAVDLEFRRRNHL